jgi:hypothetical protein
MEFEELVPWLRVEADACIAHGWMRAGWTFVEASRWLELGIRNHSVAEKWRDVSVAPQVARQWLSIPISTALPWIAEGLLPHDRRVWRTFGPSLAREWINAHCDPDQAKMLMSNGISSQYAGPWRELGVSSSIIVWAHGKGLDVSNAEHLQEVRQQQQISGSWKNHSNGGPADDHYDEISWHTGGA